MNFKENLRQELKKMIKSANSLFKITESDVDFVKLRTLEQVMDLVEKLEEKEELNNE